MCWHRPEAGPRPLRARPVRRNSHRPSKFLKIVASAAKQPPTRRSCGDACSACLRATGPRAGCRVETAMEVCECGVFRIQELR